MLIRTENVTKVYSSGTADFAALAGISLTIESGEYVALMGASGSGKSTLMHLLGCLDTPSAGHYWFKDRDVATLNDEELARLRNRDVGFVFQSFNLLPRLSALANVQLPLVYAGASPKERTARAVELLELVGLKDRMKHRPNQLSGGEMQRVAIARAMANRPAVILADEPTGNLDSRTGTDVMRLFDTLADGGNTIVVVTHDAGIAQHARRRIVLRDGLVVE